MTAARHTPAPGVGLLLGPVVGAAAAVALYQGRDALRPQVPAPWDEMLLTEAIIGQGFFVAALTFIAIEWLTALAKGGRNASWAGPARQAALTALTARPRRTERADSLRRYHAALRGALDRRWLIYGLFGLVPAFVGLVLGLAGLRAVGAVNHPYAEYFAPLLAGTAEAGLLWAVGGLARWSAAGVLDRWLADSLREEPPQPKPPAPPEPAQPAAPPPPPDNGPGPELAEKPKDPPRRTAMFD